MTTFIDLTALSQMTSAEAETATYGADAQQRMGFFTDTTLCIGCKACEVACKEWNELPQDGYEYTGQSYDNTGELNGYTWRHVAFVEQIERKEAVQDSAPAKSRWLMESDVCKHCTHAGCLDVCPTGAIIRTEFGTVVIQEDVCNGCGYCIVACPFGVISEKTQPETKGHGTMGKCTLCYAAALLSTPSRARASARSRSARKRVRPIRFNTARSTNCANARSCASIACRGTTMARIST